jgi:hypothetical protein
MAEVLQSLQDLKAGASDAAPAAAEALRHERKLDKQGRAK